MMVWKIYKQFDLRESYAVGVTNTIAITDRPIRVMIDQ